MAKYLDQTGLQHLIGKINTKISEGDAKAIKKVHFDDASRTIKFFKDEGADTNTAGDFSVIIPDDVDTSGLLAKLVGATDGNVVIAKTDGTIQDGGVKLTDLATKAELTQVSDTKIGDLTGLNTTEKNSIIGAINELKNAIDTADTEIGDLGTLTTTAQDSLVNAINELDAQVDALQRGTYDDSELREMIGTLTGLTTGAQDNLVNAINELDAGIDTVKTESTVTVEDGGADGTSAKIYVIKQNNQEIGKINIPKDMVVQSGKIVKDPVGQTAGTYVELTIANGTGDKIYINVADLVDAYTAQAGATQVQLSISDVNEISATIVAGSISATELANDAVTTAKILNANVTADKLAGNAVTTDKILDANVTESKLATDSITTNKIKDANVTLAKLAPDVSAAFDAANSANNALTNAKAYTDQEIAKITAIETGEIDAMFTP